jgi:hypothetical protein
MRKLLREGMHRKRAVPAKINVAVERPPENGAFVYAVNQRGVNPVGGGGGLRARGGGG